jgi:hypothetical protein
MRHYFNVNNEKGSSVRSALKAIADKSTSPAAYRKAFVTLGEDMGYVVKTKYPERGKTVVACPNEDADWLVSGMLKSLNDENATLRVYWADRVTVSENPEMEISPIKSSYEEPIDGCDTLIIAKSIINTSCVVRTQLTRLIGEISPKHIIIAAPVMYKDAEDNLRKEFPQEISSRFEFVTFAIDDEREGSTVIPGIGGFITERLGLGNTMADNNKYIPNIVKKRYTKYAKSL